MKSPRACGIVRVEKPKLLNVTLAKYPYAMGYSYI